MRRGGEVRRSSSESKIARSKHHDALATCFGASWWRSAVGAAFRIITNYAGRTAYPRETAYSLSCSIAVATAAGRKYKFASSQAGRQSVRQTVRQAVYPSVKSNRRLTRRRSLVP